MSSEDMKIVSGAPSTCSVTGSFSPYWNESLEKKEIRVAREEKIFRDEHDFRILDGVEVHRDKGNSGVWESKEGQIFCSCGNGELEIYIPSGEYSVSYKCRVCGRCEEVYSG
jgi:hypothetical protein